MAKYTLSDLSWNTDVMFLPGRRSPVPLRLLSYALEGEGEDSMCTISNARTGAILVEVNVRDEERHRFSALQSAILKAKLSV
ncbi:hypothetical protein JI721_04930 [Alicyclobacillus cycloheptanicus]|uniref:DUF2283 domain-containing protein n=1 Tax=Alicyclobacillus cycloheptanicus TaxID=1457 RepID=A0ABT9XHZ6_9BACL|nr:hypothetical protein [Alicyclobacillus cycloheptanicus]MDQ0189937.1 hypothetical protein [Alicyclobacillus cycloheptanicus]WDM02164.1 hypothetical protein JI721_04930 [Alicyclobacillus cycloheptanicus]